MVEGANMGHRHFSHRFLPFAGLLSLLCAATISAAWALSGKIIEFPIPTANSGPFGITAGPDGNLWFTEAGFTFTGVTGSGNKIGRITTAGSITEFSIPTANSFPVGITAGPDGNLWFIEAIGKIGRITTAGVVTGEFPIPTFEGSFPFGTITPGPDGNLWFVESNGADHNNNIEVITTAGGFGEFPVPTANSVPFVITAGPDGALWFTENRANKIGRITTAGVITEFPVPTADSGPFGITAGRDGALWFTEGNTNRVGRITTAGVITEFPVAASSGPAFITAGPDGNLWFTEFAANKVGRFSPTPSHKLTDFPVPTANSQPFGITAGPDGNIWFTEFNGNKIGQLH
jgi:streptogramin lyase